MNTESATVGELVAAYKAAATLHGDAYAEGKIMTSNRAADNVAAIYRELRQRGDEARTALLPLLLATHPRVRAWAAAHALEFAPDKGHPVLEEMSSEDGTTGFSARMTLKVWRRGELNFP